MISEMVGGEIGGFRVQRMLRSSDFAPEYLLWHTFSEASV
jgi:hypothetical protein